MSPASFRQSDNLRFEATWRSGYAEDCKSLYPGSIPGVASTFFIDVNQTTPETGSVNRALTLLKYPFIVFP